ncbi:CAP domain-containing protein [Marimonas sp. MJW-29]|uniref:CAP domain-containing protein n=1 Tax=Sulfitobacter sediminis TaxID=3234186 RepID=A0ABV3RR85_9RHOB
MRVLACLILCLVLAVPADANEPLTRALNGLRAAEGRAPVAYSKTLAQVAQAHAQDMARQGRMSHIGSDGSKIGQRVRRAGYRWCHVSENVAKGHRSLQKVLNAWAASPGHRRNMVNRKAREFGLGRVGDEYWVMVLAGPG